MGSVRLGGEGGGARRNRLYTRHGPRPGLRTVNMPLMVVTLDVSKLSGWLNADASCRVTPRLVDGDTGGGRREGAWGRCDGARSVHGGTDSTAGHGTRSGVRTASMLFMVVTLDVTKLSGWLNAFASCRVAPRHVGSARAHGGGVAVHAACTGQARRNRLDDTAHGTRTGVRT